MFEAIRVESANRGSAVAVEDFNESAGYRALFERAADAVLVADDRGVYVDANPAAVHMFGIDRSDLIGRRIADFVIEEPEILRDQWTTFVSSDGNSGRVRIRRGDGSVIICDYNATANFVPRRHLSILRDVTEAVEAQQHREQSEDRFRRLLDALDLFALVTDVDGRATFLNRALLSSLGAELDDVVGTQLARSQPDGDAQHAAFLATIASEQIIPEWENEIVLPDGSCRRISWSSAFVRDARGRIEAVASIGEDVTVRRQLEEQIRHAVRVEGLGRLAGGVAHDFNNFLTVVLGHTELLANAPELSATSREHLDQIATGIDRASRVTRQLLAFGRQQVMEMREVSVGRAIEDLRAMLAPTLGADVAVDVVRNIDDDVVFIDPSQLDQVLVNLAMNARDAMPDGGMLRLEVDATDVDGADGLLLGLNAGRYVTVTVSDTGVGIPAELVGQIFEPFVTTKPVGVGTGLGLSTAYGIVTQSGGSITVTSQDGGGTTFTIHLPIRRAGQANPTSAPAAPSEPTRVAAAGTVLVVEDDAQLRALVERVLTRAGYDVDAHESSVAALAAIARSTPSLVLTDIVMPDLDGFELAERVQSLDAEIPVLLMSGYSADASRLADVLGSSRVIDFLAKPFTINELLSSVAAALGTTSPAPAPR